MPSTTPMLGGEWSSPYTGEPPTSLSPVIDVVVRLAENIQVAAARAGAFAVPDRPRVVTIMGGRGTGKSTVLQFAAQALGANRDYVVLPVIDPEAFAVGDSLVG